MGHSKAIHLNPGTGVLVVNFGLWYNMEYAGDLVGCSATLPGEEETRQDEASFERETNTFSLK